jgi:hypothetical protein
MKLNTTPYIVQELLDKGYISADNKDKVAEVIAGEGKLSKEYQIKSKILNYLEYFSGSLVKEVDVNSVYSDIKAKFKEDAELEDGDIRYQVLNYLKKENKVAGYCHVADLVDKTLVDAIKGFSGFRYYKVL